MLRDPHSAQGQSLSQAGDQSSAWRGGRYHDVLAEVGGPVYSPDRDAYAAG